MLLQSRGNRVTDVLTAEQVNEIADAPAGVVGRAVRNVRIQQEDPYVKRAPSQAQTGGVATAASPLLSQSTRTPSGEEGGKLSDKPDSERMGVQGGRTDAQTDAERAEKAPQIVDAAVEGQEKSPGAKELERLGRDKGKVAGEIKVEGQNKTDHAG